MTALQYVPAVEPSWLLMASGSQVLFLDGCVAPDRVDALWQAMCLEATAQDLLDELTRGGISKTPAFALLTFSGELVKSQGVLHAIVRGPLVVTAYCDEELVRVVGSGTTTWAENTVNHIHGFGVVASSSPNILASVISPLHLLEGMVFASAASAGSILEPKVSDVEDVHSHRRVPSHDAAKSADDIQSSVSIENLPVAPISVVPKADPSHISEQTVSDVTVSEVMHGVTNIEDSTPMPPIAVDESGYDYLFGETIARTVEDAAVRGTEETSHGQGSVADGDHDGKTSIGLDRAARQAARRARAENANVNPSVSVRMLIELSTGVTELLDQPILIGRAPSVSKVPGASLPRLVTIAGPDQDISRNHVQVALEGDTVVVTDLHSRNGTMIILPNRPPQQLRAGEPTSVIPGTTVDLGGGVSFKVREQ